MASIGITAFMQRVCSSQHISKKASGEARPARPLGTKPAKNVVITPNLEALNLPENHKEPPSVTSDEIDRSGKKLDELSHPRFSDERWKNGTWDLNMFVKHGRMDWDSVIVAEAKRRKYLEVNPEASTNEEPVLFRSSIIPWWAWIVGSHLPEAELLNGYSRFPRVEILCSTINV